ncbi:MAG: PAS domain S-box protein, partial [Syntrophales bacterium]|nr:PAS domain S-box protein [Syntrophales bacterium]
MGEKHFSHRVLNTSGKRKKNKPGPILEPDKLKRFALMPFEGICVYANGRIIDTNQALSEMTGYSHGEFAVMDLPDLFPPEYQKPALEHLLSGIEKPFETIVVQKEGTLVPVEIQCKKINFEGHVITIGSFRDVPDHNHAEELYQILTDKLQTGVYIVQKGRLCFVNSLFEDYTGYGRSEVLGKSGLVAVHPRDKKTLRIQAAEMLKGERTSPHEFRVVTKGGQVRRVMGMVAPIIFNKSPAILGSGMDVTELREAQQRLESLEALESLILDTIPHAVLGLENRRIIFANNAVLDVFGWEPEELIGKSSRVLYRREKDFRETGRLFYGDPMKRKIHLGEVQCQRRDGTKILCALTASKLEPGARSRKAAVVFEDVTKRKQAEMALVRERDFAESLIETAPALVLVLDAKGRIVRFNPYMEDALGYPLEEVRGKDWTETFIDEREWPEAVQSFQNALSEKQSGELTNTVYTREGAKRIVNWYSKTLRGSDGALVGLLIVGQDVTEAKEAERKISENYERMRLMSSELARTEERERQQLATELHDRIGQTMAVAKMKLEAIQKEAEVWGLSEPLEEILEIVDQLIRDTRSLTFDLSPPVLYILGLSAALEWLAEQYQEKYGLKVTFKKQGKRPVDLDKDRAFVLFRCAQELLINVTKHAKAKNAVLSLKRNGKKTEILVEDDGIGIDANFIKAPKDWSKGFGLFSIRERLSFLGGRFSIESPLEGGTRIRMILY